MKKYLLILLLAGCATPQQNSEALINKLSPYCENIGYARGSEGWKGCIVKMIGIYQREQSAQQSAAPRQCYRTYTGGMDCY